MLKMLKKIVLLWLAFAGTLFVGVCNADVVAVTVEPEVTEERLRERVEGRWDALVERDFLKAYEFMSPSYRKLYSAEHYTSGFGSVVSWRSAEVLKVDIDGGSANTVVEVLYQLAIPEGAGATLGSEIGSISKDFNEFWIWSQGEWWFVDPDGGSVGL